LNFLTTPSSLPSSSALQPPLSPLAHSQNSHTHTDSLFNCLLLSPLSNPPSTPLQ
jgi:hypothetical protein